MVNTIQSQGMVNQATSAVRGACNAHVWCFSAMSVGCQASAIAQHGEMYLPHECCASWAGLATAAPSAGAAITLTLTR